MTSLVVRIYEFLRQHQWVRLLSLLFVSLCLALLVVQQTYKEDISDFLPLNNKYQQALDVYQDFSGADRIVTVFQFKDSTNTEPDSMILAIEDFQHNLQDIDSAGIIQDFTIQIDAEQFTALADFVYANIPYFLTEADYDRIDSLLEDQNYIETQLAADKQMLLFPVSSLLSDNFQKDPLNLFTPVVSRLQHSQPNVNFELYDGYIFSPDMQRAFAMMTSPYGASETENNARLLHMLHQAASKTMETSKLVDVRFAGGPVIAVENASRIKTDSIISVALAIILIVGLLYWVFRNVRNMIMIVVSIGWGWLFAMGLLASFHDKVSVIVIGISSVILGIAVNYPLHFIAHLRHTPNVRNTLKEIVMPLVVGNITTVGAFLALIPLESIALRDLGTFAAFLLIGTIVFVLLWLPHLVKVPKTSTLVHHSWLDKVSDFSLENRRWIVITVVVLTVFFGFFSFNTSFDSNMSHINYMTPKQRSDMAYFQQFSSPADTSQTIYIISSDSTVESALAQSASLLPTIQQLKEDGLTKGDHHVGQLLPIGKNQRQRLERWNDFVDKYSRQLTAEVKATSSSFGFAPSSFGPFYELLGKHFREQDLSYFNPLISTVYDSQLVLDSIAGKFHVISEIMVDNNHLKQVENHLEKQFPNSLVFDVKSMNSSIATNLSDDFNYIGWACALIVFFFLWFSLGSIELALLSFMPMAISWVWILGIMSLSGIQFNVVNVILATFIFGQGDDYTIFMTEGCQYEYAYGRKMLASYKNSIIISALIMFIGIGSLIFAKHPALYSLALVTIVGMFSVVLMAYLFPPLIFKWLIMHNGSIRKTPITILSLLGYYRIKRTDTTHAIRRFVLDHYRYRGIEIYSAVKKRMRRHNNYFNWINSHQTSAGVVLNAGWGEFAVMLSHAKPQLQILALENDPDKVTVMARCINDSGCRAQVDIQSNTSVLDSFLSSHNDVTTYLIDPSSEDIDKFKQYNPVIIQS